MPMMYVRTGRRWTNADVLDLSTPAHFIRRTTQRPTLLNAVSAVFACINRRQTANSMADTELLQSVVSFLTTMEKQTALGLWVIGTGVLAGAWLMAPLFV